MAIEKTNPVLNDQGVVKGGLRIINDGAIEGERILVRVYSLGAGKTVADKDLVLIDTITSDPMPKPKAGTKWATSVRIWAEQVGAV